MKFSFIAILIFTSGCMGVLPGSDLTWTAYQKNRDAVAALKAETPDLAVLALTEGLASSPFQSELHLNLGLAFSQQKKGEEALKSLRTAESLAKDPETRFAARYNLGVLATEAKQIDEALMWYQRALEIVPDSIEVKTNIELLQQSQDGQGEGESKEGEGDKSQDPKDSEKGEGQDEKEKKEDPSDGEGEKDEPKEYGQPPPQYKPREFQGELHEADVKKILGEIKQQEQRIRTEYNRRDAKERPRDKDW